MAWSYQDRYGPDTIPVGAIMAFPSNIDPAGWLLCYGQAVSRTQVPTDRLFRAIGTTYGAGDGSTTFNVPDCRGRVIAGKDNMGGTSANRIAATFDGDVLGQTGGSESSFSVTTAADMAGGGSNSYVQSASGTVVQPTIIFNMYIKL